MNDKQFNKRIGEKLKEIRLACNLKQKDVIEILGMHQPQYSLIEKGGGGLSFYQVYLLCEKLKINIKYFIYQDEKMKSDYKVRLGQDQMNETNSNPTVIVNKGAINDESLKGLSLNISIKF